MPSSAFFPQDGISGHLKTIDPVHAIIHDGKYFTATHYVTVGTGTAVTVLVTPPLAATGYELHFTAEITTNNAGVLQFCENPTASGGTAVVSYNHRRGSAIVTPATIVHTATVATVGTVLETFITSGTSTNKVTIGMEGGQRDEWIPDPADTYLFKFVADNASTRVLIKCKYYYR